MTLQLSENTENCLADARLLARSYADVHVEGLHLLCALARYPLPAQALLAFELDGSMLRSEVARGRKMLTTKTLDDPPLSDEAQRALQSAHQKAEALRAKMVQPHHLLLGLASFEDGSAVDLLYTYGVPPATLHYQMLQELANAFPSAQEPDLAEH